MTMTDATDLEIHDRDDALALCSTVREGRARWHIVQIVAGQVQEVTMGGAAHGRYVGPLTASGVDYVSRAMGEESARQEWAALRTARRHAADMEERAWAALP